MALGDYILCDRCNCKLIYDGDMGNREWWVERFGKEPEFYCPPCQQEMAMARVQLLGQRLDDAKDGARWRFMNTLPRHKVDRIVYSEPDSWDAVIDNMMGEQNG